MRATPSRTQVSRYGTSELGGAFYSPNAGMGEPGAGEPGPEHSPGPQLSEQLDMLADLFAARRQADLERRGLFLHPEVF